jgi:hypothetical protein
MSDFENKSIDEILEEMEELISITRGDARRFDGGVKAPATNIRKNLFTIKELAFNLRKEIMKRKNSMPVRGS